MATAVTGIVGLGWIRIIANRNALAQEHYRAIIAERSRLATELHDTLEQGLAGIQLQLGAVARTLDSLKGDDTCRLTWRRDWPCDRRGPTSRRASSRCSSSW